MSRRQCLSTKAIAYPIVQLHIDATESRSGSRNRSLRMQTRLTTGSRPNSSRLCPFAIDARIRWIVCIRVSRIVLVIELRVWLDPVSSQFAPRLAIPNMFYVYGFVQSRKLMKANRSLLQSCDDENLNLRNDGKASASHQTRIGIEEVAT